MLKCYVVKQRLCAVQCEKESSKADDQAFDTLLTIDSLIGVSNKKKQSTVISSSFHKLPTFLESNVSKDEVLETTLSNMEVSFRCAVIGRILLVRYFGSVINNPGQNVIATAYIRKLKEPFVDILQITADEPVDKLMNISDTLPSGIEMEVSRVSFENSERPQIICPDSLIEVA